MAGRAAVLWSGGKESSLSLYEAQLSGYDIVCLVTFTPPNPEFLAHPLGFMEYQAEALDLPHHTIVVNEPYKESYGESIRSLNEEWRVDTLITGDIGEVCGHPNYIRECAEYAGVDVVTPLWGRDKVELLNQLLSQGFRAIFSCVKKPWFTEEWVGRELSVESVEKLLALGSKGKFDVCGDQGEYHTLVVDCPVRSEP